MVFNIKHIIWSRKFKYNAKCRYCRKTNTKLKNNYTRLKSVAYFDRCLFWRLFRTFSVHSSCMTVDFQKDEPFIFLLYHLQSYKGRYFKFITFHITEHYLGYEGGGKKQKSSLRWTNYPQTSLPSALSFIIISIA